MGVLPHIPLSVRFINQTMEYLRNCSWLYFGSAMWKKHNRITTLIRQHAVKSYQVRVSNRSNRWRLCSADNSVQIPKKNLSVPNSDSSYQNGWSREFIVNFCTKFQAQILTSVTSGEIIDTEQTNNMTNTETETKKGIMILMITLQRTVLLKPWFEDLAPCNWSGGWFDISNGKTTIICTWWTVQLS